MQQKGRYIIRVNPPIIMDFYYTGTERGFLMDISQSSLSRYKAEKKGVSRSASDTSSSSASIRAKGTSDSSKQSLNQLGHKAGQQIKGQILDRRYNEITLRIEPGNQVITAKLTGNIPLSIGQEAYFQISEGANDSLILKYIPDDSDSITDALILKALSASGLGATDRNRSIVQELLNQNMPIDKHTLQNLIRQLGRNHDASPQTLVLLYKNNIPLTPENIRQFEIYQNGTNRLVQDIRAITGNLSELLLQENGLTNTDNETPGSYPQPDTSENEQILHNTYSRSHTPSSVNGQANMIPSLSDVFTRILRINTGLIDILYPEEVRQNIVYPQDAVVSQESEASALDTLMQNSTAGILSAQTSADTPIEDILKPSELLNLSEYVKSLPGSDGMQEEIKDGTIGLQKLLTYIKENLSSMDPSSKMQDETINHFTCHKLLQSLEYSHLLENAFLKRWTVNPDEIAGKAPVQELYHNLQEDMDKLSQLVRLTGDDEASLQIREPLKNLQENISFMKDLNEMFTYLQLPVRLRDRSLHSELYVYTRKRSLKERPDSISVLLHLDMEHLGPLNIYIEMKQSLIQAKFYTEDNETGLLLGNQIPLLDAALSKKGYKLQTEIRNTYKEPDFVKDFIAQDLTDGSVKHYTFDIRT